MSFIINQAGASADPTQFSLEFPAKPYFIGLGVAVDYMKSKNAETIQRVVRGHLESAKFQAKKVSAIVIQSVYRGSVESSKFQSKKVSAIVIQSVYRGSVESSKFQSKKASAIEIQRVYRGNVESSKFQAEKAAAPIMQRVVRGHLERKKIQAEKAAAPIMQRVVRGHLERKQIKAKEAKYLGIRTSIQEYNKGFVEMMEKLNQAAKQQEQREAFLAEMLEKGENEAFFKILEIKSQTEGKVVASGESEDKVASGPVSWMGRIESAANHAMKYLFNSIAFHGIFSQ